MFSRRAYKSDGVFFVYKVTMNYRLNLTAPENRLITKGRDNLRNRIYWSGHLENEATHVYECDKFCRKFI